MGLYERINGLRKSQYWADEFSAGYDQAKFESAQIAKEADELMEEMADELRWCADDENIAAVLRRYNNWKDQTK